MALVDRLASSYIAVVRRPFEEACKRTARCLWSSEAASFLLYAAVFSSLVASSACLVLCGVRGLLFLLIAATPPLAARIYRHIVFDSHRRGLAAEEPYFLVYASAMHASGMPLYAALEALDDNMLPTHGREAARYRRIVRVIQDPHEALARLADTSISRSFSRFLRSYIGALRSGTGLDAFFEVRIEEAIRRVRDAWTRFSELAGEVGEALSLINVLGVFMVLLYGAIGGYSPPMIVGAAVTMPLVSGLAYLYVGQEAPGLQGGVEAPLWLRLAYPASLLAGASTYILLHSPWIAVAAAAAPLLAAGAVFERAFIAPLRGVEASIPSVIRGLSDYSRLGYPLSKSLARVAEEEENKVIRKMLHMLRSTIDSGEESMLPAARSLPGHARYVFTMIHALSRTMLVPPRALEALASFVGEAVYAKAKVIRRLRMHEIILYVFAPLVIYSLKALVEASASLMSGAGSQPFVQGPAITLEDSTIALIMVPAVLSHGMVVERLVTGVGWQCLRKGIALLLLGLSGLLIMG